MGRARSGWWARCQGRQAEAERPSDAVRAALAGGALPLRPDPALERWIDETAARIEREALEELS